MARVRVFLCTYRRPQLLRRALESLLAQTLADWVCELHNDAPDDDAPRAVLAKLAPDDARFTYHPHERNLGAVATFNLAFSTTPEPFISLLEDDNWWEPTLLATLLEELDRRPECDVAWANMRLWREEPNGDWTDTGRTIWPVINPPALTIAWPQPLQIDSPLHSNGAMLVRSAGMEHLRVPSTVPFDMIEPFRERLFRYPLLFIPKPLANFALTRETARSHDAGDWLESQTLQAACFLKHAGLDKFTAVRLWRARREAFPPATTLLFFAGLLAARGGFLRSANARDWLRFFCGIIRHPRFAVRALMARRRRAELWKELNRATHETCHRTPASADVAPGLLVTRGDLRSAPNALQ